MTTATKVRRPVGRLQRDSQARTSCLRRFNSGCPLARVRTLQLMDELTTSATPSSAGGGRRPGQPALPRLRRAALRMAGRAGAPGRAGEPLRGLWPRHRRRLARGPRRRSPRSTGWGTRTMRGSSTGRASPARSAAPAGPGSSRARTTSSRSRRSAASSPSATRSCAGAAGPPARAWRLPGRRSSIRSPSATTSRWRRSAKARRRPPTSPGSAASTSSPASSWRSRRRVIALPIELSAVLFRRGAVVDLRFELL